MNTKRSFAAARKCSEANSIIPFENVCVQIFRASEVDQHAAICLRECVNRQRFASRVRAEQASALMHATRKTEAHEASAHKQIVSVDACRKRRSV